MSRPRLVAVPRTLHTTDRPSVTAQWTTLGRALEQHRPAGDRIVDDPFAPVFLSAVHRRALGLLPMTGPLGPLVHRLERTGVAGIATSALCRHAFIDAHLRESLPEVEQVIVLGAGYDSRAYRFARAIGDRALFEVDLPPLSRAKAAIVRDHPDRFGHASVHRVEIDFRTQSLHTRLAESGLRLGAPSFVVWEGVSMYLSREAVLDTLAALAAVCGRGSVVAMDFWQDVPGHAPLDRVRRTAVRSMRLIGEPITFTLPSTAAADFLAPTGFPVLDLATGPQLAARYSTGDRACDDGLYVVAAGLR